jgi:transposase
MSSAAPAFVGIDVAKALVQRVCGHAPTLIVLEATGGYERAAVAALAAALS